MQDIIRDIWEAFMPVVLTILVPTIGAGLLALIVKGFQKLGVDISASQRDTFQSALTNAAGILIQRLGPQAAMMTGLANKLHDPSVAAAVAAVRKGAPDGVEKWKVTDAEIAKGIEAKLGILTGPTGEGGAVASVPVTKAV